MSSNRSGNPQCFRAAVSEFDFIKQLSILRKFATANLPARRRQRWLSADSLDLVNTLHSKIAAGLKRLARRFLSSLGYDTSKRKPSKADPLCEGFDRYLFESTKAGIDVNDWIEEQLGWEPALPTLRKVVFPYIEQTSCVCEIGAGTGRHARHIIPLIGKGKLHLFDHSSWIRSHLKNYFSKVENVYVGECDGASIGLAADSVDLCFSNGAFIEFKLGTILLFAKEFWRILKRNGYVIFDYIDISTEEAWQHLKSQSAVHHRTFTYHCGHTIDKVFASVGFTVLERHQEDKSTYVVFQKI